MNFPQRKYPRAKWHDYDSATYFVTVCTKNMAHYLGSVQNGIMTMSKTGLFLDKTLADVSLHHDYARVPEWVVMPNHFHALVIINHIAPSYLHSRITGSSDLKRSPVVTGEKRGMLSVVIGGIKASVTRHANLCTTQFAWQKRFHDHIVRNQDEYFRIVDYIRHNPERWAEDCYHTY